MNDVTSVCVPRFSAQGSAPHPAHMYAQRVSNKLLPRSPDRRSTPPATDYDDEDSETDRRQSHFQ